MNRIKKTEPCHGCGETVLLIKCTNGKTYTVDPEPVWIRKKTGGDSYISIEGDLVFGDAVGDAYDITQPGEQIMEAYTPHKGHCPNGGRKRRWK